MLNICLLAVCYGHTPPFCSCRSSFQQLAVRTCMHACVKHGQNADRHDGRTECLPDMVRLDVSGPYHVSDLSFSDRVFGKSRSRDETWAGQTTRASVRPAPDPLPDALHLNSQFPRTPDTTRDSRRMTGEITSERGAQETQPAHVYKYIEEKRSHGWPCIRTAFIDKGLPCGF